MPRTATRGAAVDAGDSDRWLEDLLPSEEVSALSHGSKTAALALGQEVSCSLMQIIERKASDLVRLALFTEYTRHSLRRDDVMKKIIGKDASRAFPAIFAHAQHMLRTIFGFELAELRARNQENPLLAEQAEALDERVGSKRRRSEGRGRKDLSSAALWILRSNLPPNLIAKITQGDGQQSALIDWSTDAQLAGMGLLFVVLSIVLLCGRRVDEGRLRAYLAQLSLSVDRPLPSALQPFHTSDDAGLPTTSQAYPRFSGEHQLTLETYLTRLQRQGYLEKVRTETVRFSDGSAPSPTVEYRWGPRAEVEVGEQAVGAFVARMFGPVKNEEGEVSPELMKTIERAAGTPLVG